jgi:hypothetical protein
MKGIAGGLSGRRFVLEERQQFAGAEDGHGLVFAQSEKLLVAGVEDGGVAAEGGGEDQVVFGVRGYADDGDELCGYQRLCA